MTAPRHSPARPARRGARHQRGAAALLVVMALFFLVSMVAAYSSRNLVFEQRTSANQYRATQALEVAEGGVEWALAALQGGRIDGACAGTADAASSSYRARYLTVDPANGTVAAVRAASACQLTSTGWECACPTAGDPTLPPAQAGVSLPAFRVDIQDLRTTGRNTPGVFRIDSIGCSAGAAGCQLDTTRAAGEAGARVNVTVALVPALATVPVAAVTVRQAVQISGGSGYAIVNDDASVGGITVHAGDAAGFSTGAVQLASVPGKPDPQSVIVPDATLAGLQPEDFFRRFLGVSPQAFQRQANTVRFPDPAVPACRDNLQVCVTANPGRPVWVDGDLEIDAPMQLGTPDVPLLLVVNGGVRLDSAGAVVTGVVYSRAAELPAIGTGSIRGALVAEGDVKSPVNVQYDATVIARIRHGQGPVIRLPGGWKDF